MEILRFILSTAPSVLLIVLFAILVKASAYREFPWFFIYVSFAVISDILRFSVRNIQEMYFYTYWTTEAIYCILGIVVFYELFRKVFLNLTKMRFLRLVFPIAVLFSAALSVVRAHVFPPHMATALISFIVSAELAVRLLQSFIFGLLVILVYFFGLRWKQYAFGIAAGFGIYATTALICTTRFSESGTSFTFLWGAVMLVSYSIAVLIWIWFFSRPRLMGPSRDEQDFPPISPQDLERYEKTARRILRR